MLQASKKIEMILLFPCHYYTVTMMIAAAGGTERSGFHLSGNGCGMPAAMVSAMPVAALRHLAAIWTPGYNSRNGASFNLHQNAYILRYLLVLPN